MGGNNVSIYSYTAAVAIGLAAGPIGGVGKFWQDKNRFLSLSDYTANLSLTIFPGESPQAPWGYLSALHSPEAIGYSGLAYVATPVMNLDGSAALPNCAFEVYGLGMTAGASEAIASVMGPTWFNSNWDGSGDTWTGSTYAAGTSAGLSLVSTGAGADTYAGAAMRVTFTGVTLLNATSLSTGQNFTIPSGGVVPFGSYMFASPEGETGWAITGLDIASLSASSASSSVGPGVLDENPAVIVADLLARAGFPAGEVGSLADYSNYCLAANLLVSPAYTQQAAAKDMLLELTAATNSEFVWSQGTLTLAPYADASFTGNGVIFTPNLTPVYDLTDDDFIVSTAGTPGDRVSGIIGQTSGLSTSAAVDDPVQCNRSTTADAFNHIQIEYSDRDQDYNAVIAEAKDQADIEAKGLRTKAPIAMHFICDRSIAQAVAQIILQRSLYVRNTYTFRLSWSYCLLEPMDLLTINDALMGLNQAPVRARQISEDADGLLTFTVEECQIGVYAHALHAHQNPLGYLPNYQASPGDANAPVIWEVPKPLVSGSNPEIWFGLSGGASWGGADVWASHDGVSYSKVATATGPAKQGVLTASLAVTSDPDTVETLAVDLSESGGALLSGTQADADNLNTLCYVGGEYISYKTATLTAANRYALAYLRRGAYASPILAHSAGAPFLRLDQSIVRYAYDPALIGSTVYFKFVSRNVYGGGGQDISQVAAHSYTVTGSGATSPYSSGSTVPTTLAAAADVDWFSLTLITPKDGVVHVDANIKIQRMGSAQYVTVEIKRDGVTMDSTYISGTNWNSNVDPEGQVTFKRDLFTPAGSHVWSMHIFTTYTAAVNVGNAYMSVTNL